MYVPGQCLEIATSLKWQPTWSSKSLKVHLKFTCSFLATQKKKKLLGISLTSLGAAHQNPLPPTRQQIQCFAGNQGLKCLVFMV